MEYFDSDYSLNRKLTKLNRTLDRTTNDLRSMDQFVAKNKFNGYSEDFNEHDIHDLHQAIRDVAFGQNKIMHQLNEVQKKPSSSPEVKRNGDSFNLSPAMLKALEAPAVRRIQAELEAVQRSLARETANNAALNIRLNQSELNFQRIDKTRAQLAARVTELETKLDLNQAQLTEKDSLKFHNQQLLKQMDDLKKELTQSVPLSKYEVSQNRLTEIDVESHKLQDKNRQIKNELDEKSNQILSLLKELKDSRTSYESLESEKEQLLVKSRHLELENRTLIAKCEANLQEYKQSSELVDKQFIKQSDEMSNLKIELDSCRKRCFHLESEIENLHNAFNDEIERTRLSRIEEERLTKELEDTRMHLNTLAADFKHLLEERTRIEALLKESKESEEFYRLQVQEIEAKMVSWQKESERLSFELNSVSKNYEYERNERCHLLEKLSSMELENNSIKEKSEHLQASLDSQREELAYVRSLKEQTTLQSQEIAELKNMLDKQKNQLSKKLSNLSLNYDELNCHSSQKIIELQAELETRKASYVELEARCRRQAEEIFRLNEELWRSQDHINQLSKRLDKRLLEVEQMRDGKTVSPSPSVDDGLVEKWSSQIKLIEEERNRVLRWMASEVEALIHTMTETGVGYGPIPETYTIPPANLDLFELNVARWSADMRFKMSWLRDAVRNLRTKLGEMKTNVKRIGKTQSERDKTESNLSAELSELQNKFDLVSNQFKEEKRKSKSIRSSKSQNRYSPGVRDRCQRVQDTLDTVKYDLECIEKPIIPPIPKLRRSLSRSSLQ